MFNRNRPWHSQFQRKPKIERTVQGKVFDSVGEGDRYCYLLNLERAKIISGLDCQIKFILELPDGTPVMIGNRVCSYKADFSYMHAGKKIYEEFKGFDDSTSRLRRAVVEAIYKIKIIVVKKPTGLPGVSTAKKSARRKRITANGEL